MSSSESSETHCNGPLLTTLMELKENAYEVVEEARYKLELLENFITKYGQVLRNLNANATEDNVLLYIIDRSEEAFDLILEAFDESDCLEEPQKKRMKLVSPRVVQPIEEFWGAINTYIKHTMDYTFGRNLIEAAFTAVDVSMVDQSALDAIVDRYGRSKSTYPPLHVPISIVNMAFARALEQETTTMQKTEN